MTYLLDVNVLIALTHPGHVHHNAAHAWMDTVGAWATTPITESGFVRLLMNPRIAGREVTGAEAIELLRGVRGRDGHSFIGDESSLADAAIGLDMLVGTKQVTDLHLVNLAKINELVFATFDGRIVQWLSAEERAGVEVIAAV
ncbi:TA system VapC family ribonuclease toxin [Microlunatus elymi]|uniref:TA system VapC family ribonuclease toxin n=1 Tax=Microlunatus elymi TaxID=2596828 RepID=UPI00143D0DFA|nr:TA system VapC family ribonuclease toxin [Microlunatus elymi]